MESSGEPESSYERKIQLILSTSLARFQGQYTEDEYQLERTVAINILDALGVKS